MQSCKVDRADIDVVTMVTAESIPLRAELMLPLDIPSTTIPVSFTPAPHLIPNLCQKVKLYEGKYGEDELNFSLRNSSTSVRPAALSPV